MLHDWASKGHGSIPGFTSQTDLHSSLCKHACKDVCDVTPGINSYPLLAQSCNRWWPDVVTFTACKKSRFGLKRGKKAQCVSNRCKDLIKRKKYFGVRNTLTRANVSFKFKLFLVTCDIKSVSVSFDFRDWILKHSFLVGLKMLQNQFCLLYPRFHLLLKTFANA